MNAKIFSAAAAALIALTSVASADGVNFSDSQRDVQLREQANRVGNTGGYVTTPAIDPAYSQRDAQLREEADDGALVTTHGGREVYVTKPVIDPAYSQRGLQLRQQALGAEAE